MLESSKVEFQSPTPDDHTHPKTVVSQPCHVPAPIRTNITLIRQRSDAAESGLCSLHDWRARAHIANMQQHSPRQHLRL
jgi:hypothetical protein